MTSITNEQIMIVQNKNDEPLTVTEYKKTILKRIEDVKSGTAKTFTSEQVLNRILKK
ncbi:hypothetical protein [Flavobacterium ovatum]|uniref:hypothetical protein n=1 Tax=Flavobacterium ovatum TaxID=1928857 RepID=UPI00344B34A3